MNDNDDGELSYAEFNALNVRASYAAREAADFLCNQCEQNGKTNVQLLALAAVRMATVLVATLTTTEDASFDAAVLVFRRELRRAMDHEKARRNVN